MDILRDIANAVKDVLYECRYLWIFSIMAIVFLLAYGFMENTIFIDVPDEVVRYCEVKYGEDFTWLEFISDKSDLYSKISKVRSDDTGLTFLVSRFHTESGDVEYCDNYSGYLSEDYIKEIVKSKISKSATFSIVIDDSSIVETEDVNISAGDYIDDKESIICLKIKDNHIWSFKEAEKFCKSLPFRVNAYLECNGETSHFATTEDYEVVYR